MCCFWRFISSTFDSWPRVIGLSLCKHFHWFYFNLDGPLPSVLQEVTVPVINNSVCESMYRSAGYIEHIPHIFICAGWRKGGFDSCEGDSGGPMVIQREDKRWFGNTVTSDFNRCFLQVSTVRHYLVGYRVRRTQSAGGLHQN